MTELLKAPRNHRSVQLPCSLLRLLHAHYKSSVAACGAPWASALSQHRALQGSVSYR